MKLNSKRKLALVILVAWVCYIMWQRLASGVTGFIPILLQTLSYLTTPESIFLILVLVAWFIQAGIERKK